MSISEINVKIVNVPTILQIPKVQMAFFLCLIYLSTFIEYPLFPALYLFLTSVGFCLFFDLLFTLIRKRAFFVPWAGLVTGLIITLIIDPKASWYQVAIICAISMGSKNFLRISARHIFNPASLGLFLGGIIFDLNVSWWGVSFQTLNQLSIKNLTLFAILFLPGLVSFYNLRRKGSILSFLLIYILHATLLLFLGSSLSLSSLIFAIVNPAILFFALVMLPEPMTSPINYKRQIFYGASVVLITIFLSQSLITNFLLHYQLLPDIIIPALLIGNALFFKFR